MSKHTTLFLKLGLPVIGIVLLLGLGPDRSRAQNASQVESLAGEVTVDLSRGPVAEFLPDEAFGAALDGQKRGEVDRIYTPENIAKMRTAGLKKIAYSLRTELGIEAWHWSEQGTWSDPEHQQGYWTSSDRPDQYVTVSHGYRLPRRGNTFDQAENDGYSRLTDGDQSTSWKSNPYLDQHYTDESNALHPQWVVIDFGKAEPVNAVRIDWDEPHATRFEVQFWNSSDSDFQEANGEWHTFLNGLISNDSGGASKVFRLSGTPVQVRYIRIRLLQSSATARSGSTDIRDSLGFAIREISLGVTDASGALQDEIRHGPSNETQTAIYTSSTDPWHRASDLDANTEQPGFDVLFRSGLTHDLPALISVPLLYDTPENAAAEISFLKARGYPVRQVVMGEEPDGQLVSTEDEAALFLQFATAIHNVDPTLALGGPSFQGGIVYSGFDVEPNRSWLARFFTYLRDHGRLDDYKFLSFQWYPFDDLCQDPSKQLLQQPELLNRVFATFRQEGVPPSLPVIITEYGFAPFAARTLVELPSALMNAEIVGQFLTLGGKATFLYGLEPMPPISQQGACGGYGQLMLFEAGDNGQARWPMPTYFAARLLTQEWALPVNHRHEVYPATTDILDKDARGIVTAYAVARPDGKLAIMLVNKDPHRAYSVHIKFVGGKSAAHFAGKVAVFQYSRQQYAWLDAGPNGRPIRDEAPRQFAIRDDGPVNLPPYSLTIVRGNTPVEALQFAGNGPPRAGHIH
jgi:F5/8 type C domain.